MTSRPTIVAISLGILPQKLTQSVTDFPLLQATLLSSIVPNLTILIYSNTNQGGGGQGGPNLPPPVPCNPGYRPFFLGFLPFALFRLRNIMQCYVIFPYFSRFPPFWNSRLPPFPLPPPVPLPPLFSRAPAPLSPCPPPTNQRRG